MHIAVPVIEHRPPLDTVLGDGYIYDDHTLLVRRCCLDG
jgi:hypothetical protein